MKCVCVTFRHSIFKTNLFTVPQGVIPPMKRGKCPQGQKGGAAAEAGVVATATEGFNLRRPLNRPLSGKGGRVSDRRGPSLTDPVLFIPYFYRNAVLTRPLSALTCHFPPKGAARESLCHPASAAAPPFCPCGRFPRFIGRTPWGTVKRNDNYIIGKPTSL